jgi:hypothetical protein
MPEIKSNADVEPCLSVVMPVYNEAATPKTGWRDGVHALWCIFKYDFISRA